MDPSVHRTSDLLTANGQKLGSVHPHFGDLISAARSKMIDDAIKYTSAYRDVDWVDKVIPTTGRRSPRIIMAGHQPALFHPGVWFKNFMLSHLGQKHGCLPINLVIDNDVASGSSVRVPTLTQAADGYAWSRVEYDNAGGGVPYEQTTIRDRHAFDNFDQNVRSALTGVVAGPCVDQLWKHAIEAISRCGVAGCALAQARHGFEGELGLQTLELPISVLCRGPEFAEFALYILSDLARFQQCYNDEAKRYRAAHGIRSSAHPVPNLAREDEWLEAPLWIYGDDSPVRRRVWLRSIENGLELSDRVKDASVRKSVRIDTQFPKLAAQQLASHCNANFKLRPRALVTTMYARLILSDLFLHGIGGGKYDQLGDRIAHSFFSFEPPEFMVVSATVQLPGAKPDASQERLKWLKRKQREIDFQPERFANEAGLDKAVLAKKSQLLANGWQSGKKKDWHDQITDINEQLASELAGPRNDIHNQIEEARLAIRSSRIISSREHPFCAYPIAYLQDTYRRMLAE